MFEAIIPLRSKSRGLKDKNILLFKRRLSLVNFTIKKLINIKEIRKIYILTDSNIYKKKILKHKKLTSLIKEKKHFLQITQKLIPLFMISYPRTIKINQIIGFYFSR